MRVVATKLGFLGGLLRNPGDEFEVPEGSTATWFIPAEPIGGSVQKPTARRRAPKKTTSQTSSSE